MLDAVTSPGTHDLIGAAIEVQRTMGVGFLETAYQEALAIEFTLRGIPFVREARLPISYKGQILRTVHRADFVSADTILELKATSGLGPADEAQMINYLRASGLKVGLLLNFGVKPLHIRRLVLEHEDAFSLGSASSAVQSASLSPVG